MTSLLGDLWRPLVHRISSGRCTPFLGAGAAADVLPAARQIAIEWADEYRYPYPDRTNLATVAQFIADKTDDHFYPKRLMAQRLVSAQSRRQGGLDDPYDTLAQMPFTVYVTTNYDDLMERALVQRGKNPKLEVCAWNHYVRKAFGSVFDTEYEPSPDEPLIYHLHGHQTVPESLVLTDDDYLDFLLAAFSDRSLIPPVVQEAIAGCSLLFIGYRLYDWNFRMLFRRFSMAGLQRVNFAVLLPPAAADGANMEFLQQADYFSRLGIQSYLGTARQFTEELRRHYNEMTS